MDALPPLHQLEFVALNTLGLTGAEILLAELNRFPEVLALPGQNFIQSGNACYRPHVFEGLAPELIFENLSLHQFTRSGHCWAGLTKSMSAALREKYESARPRHRDLFLQNTSPSSTPMEIFSAYIWSYHQAMESRRPEARFITCFGNNILVNGAAYSDFAPHKAIDFTNRPAYWLATIGQRMVWDNLAALKFWIVNSLFNRLFALEHPDRYLAIDIEDLRSAPIAATDRIRHFLGLGPWNENHPFEKEDGFIAFNPQIVARIDRDSAVLEEIYRGEKFYEMARALPNWSGAFLADEENRNLLRKYAAYWNSTTHTNFDWIGPVENEILEKAGHHFTQSGKKSISVIFYHDYFRLRSDDYQNPIGSCEHYLGILEDEILLPEMPFPARIALAYLENVARNYLKRPYSGKMIRETLMWDRLKSLHDRGHFKAWAMEDRWHQANHLIDQAEAAMRPFYPPAKPSSS